MVGKVVQGVQPQVGFEPPSDATLATRELNLVQAFKLCRDLLADKSRGDVERAVALCWAMSLIGDLHHPMHVGSLYAPPTFPAPHGDQHGKLIFIGAATFYDYIESVHGECAIRGHIRRIKETWEKDELWQMIINSSLTRLDRGTYSYLDDPELLCLMASTTAFYSQIDDAVDLAVRRGELAPLRIEPRANFPEFYQWSIRVRAVEAASELRLLLDKSL